MDVLVLGGTILGGTIDTVYVEKKGYGKSFPKYAFPVSKNGTFNDTLHLSYGYYNITAENKEYEIYLEPTFDLRLKLDLEKEIIGFTGTGQKENDYLQRKKSLREETFHVDYYKYHAILNENQFLITNDSVRTLYLDLLEQSKIKNRIFVELERKSILVDKVYNLMGFEIEKRLLTDAKEFEVSDSFPNPEELLDINDHSFLDIPFFVVLLANNHYYFLKDRVNLDTSTEILKCTDCDLFNEYLNYMGSALKNEKIRNAVTFLISKWTLGKAENIDAFYTSYESFNSDKDNLSYISKIYKNLKSNRGRDFLLNAPLKDIDDKPLTLKDFTGKYLYLDFWSSSCAPCIKEFPEFNELSDKLKGKNIEFIGINILDTKERWLGMIQKNDLRGVQLTIDKNTKFLDSLGVNGIPRYMMLDDVGNVLDFNAKRPSDPKTKSELLSLILE
tara:strand:+ start:211 stop:1545 length:1335 start_codon:yes stop_codon:yes gene_type:complete